MNTAPFPSYRGVTAPQERDVMGHMNVQFYGEKAEMAIAAAALHLGLSPSLLRREGLTLLSERDRILYLREVHVGDALCMNSAFAGAENDSLLLKSRLGNIARNTDAAAFHHRLYLADRQGRRLPLPQQVREKAQDLRYDWQELPQPRGMASAPAEETDKAFLTYRSSIDNWHCNSAGFMTRRAYIDCFSSAAGQLLGRIGIYSADIRSRGVGTVALEYDIRYLRPLRAGEFVTLRSSLLNMGEKTIAFCHHMRAGLDEELVATVAVTGVAFDLNARRAIAIPNDIRERIAALLPAAAQEASS